MKDKVKSYIYFPPIRRRGNALIGFLLLLMSIFSTNCKKFLNVDGLDALSGNNYWQTEADVEKYAIGVYAQMRVALISNYLYNFAGDWRAGFWSGYSSAPGGNRTFITYAAQNNIRQLLNANATYAGSNQAYWGIATMLDGGKNTFSGVTTTVVGAWPAFYKMVAAANIMYSKIDEVPDPNFSDASRKKYKAEAVYLRCMAYFFLCRLFGNVPYYTQAYNSTALPRTDLVTIFKDCVKNLNEIQSDLPWTYSDPANVGVRAMRGGALVMSMEMNMWLAGFDSKNDESYWTATDSLGKELINENGGAYSLIPIEKYPTIYRGKSSEALIEISKNANYGESNYGFDSRNYGFGGFVTHSPVGSVQSSTSSTGAYSGPNAKFMSNLYPSGSTDKRISLWFNSNIYADNASFEFFKYSDLSLPTGTYNSPGLLITRYADAYLLRAEALADLGNVTEAAKMLNVIRTRAGATLYPAAADKSLDDAIWNERVKEFMLEGHYYFDLVRTKKILDNDYCLYPISLEAFNNGAWTWPIPPSAFSNNPSMTQTTWWSNN